EQMPRRELQGRERSRPRNEDEDARRRFDRLVHRRRRRHRGGRRALRARAVETFEEAIARGRSNAPRADRLAEERGALSFGSVVTHARARLAWVSLIFVAAACRAVIGYE